MVRFDTSSLSYLITVFTIGADYRGPGCETVVFPVVRDSKGALTSASEEARKVADLMLINDGSSKGAEDYTADLLEQGASCYAHGVNLALGRVVATAVVDGTPVMNLPRPTIAVCSAMDWIGRYVVEKLRGIEFPAPIP